MTRTLNVVRMQLINRQTFVWVPLLILGGSLALSLVIFSLIPYEGEKCGGAAQSTYWYFLALGVLAMSATFPFSQAMSVTRREFYLGTLATAALASGILAALFIVGGFIEQATNGWGLNGYYFYIAADVGERMVGRLVHLVRRRDAVLRDRVLGGHDLQAVGHLLARRRS